MLPDALPDPAMAESLVLCPASCPCLINSIGKSEPIRVTHHHRLPGSMASFPDNTESSRNIAATQATLLV